MKLDEIARKLELEYNEESKIIFGKNSCYHICVKLDRKRNYSLNGYQIILSVKKKNEKPDIDDIKLIVKNNNIKNFVINQYEVFFIINHSKHPKKNDAKDLAMLIQKITSVLKQMGYIDCCQSCGSENQLSIFMLNKYPSIECASCFAQNRKIGDYDTTDIPDRYKSHVLGFFGAFISSLIGFVVIVTLMQINFMDSISGALLSIVTIYGYKKLTGKLDLKGILICSVVIIIMANFSYKIGIAVQMTLQNKNDVLLNYSKIQTYLTLGWMDEGDYNLNFVGLYFFAMLGFIYNLRKDKLIKSPFYKDKPKEIIPKDYRLYDLNRKSQNI